MFLVKKAAVGTGYITLMSGINLGISFVFYITIARILTPDEIGSISLLLLLIAAFSTLTSLALNSAATKYISEYSGMRRFEKASAAFREGVKLLSAVALPSFVFMIIISPHLATLMAGVDAPLISMALAAGLILNYTTILGGAFYGLFLYSSVAIQNIIFAAFGRFSAVALANLGLRVYGVALGILIGALACLIYSILAFRGRLQRTRDLFPARSLLSYSTPLYVANIIVLAQGWLDLVVLYSITADLPTVGIYYLVISSTAILTLLPNSLASVLFPTISYKIGESGPESAKEILGTCVHLSLLIIMPISFALAATAPTALTIAYGAKYSIGGTALAVAALGVIPLTIYTMLVYTLQAVGSTRPVALAGGVAVSAELVTLLLAVPIFSGVGAALARFVMASAGFAVSYIAIHSKLKYSPRGDWRILAYACLAAIPIFVIEQTISLDVLTKGLMELVTFVFTTMFLLKILKPFSDTEKSIIECVLPKNLKRIALLIIR